jgi:L-aspartate oxidase
MTHLDGSYLRARFPRIYSTCMQYNVDIASELVPIRPAAHYAMGGVRTDLHGRTNVPGLYAAGEVACTGVHGGNRLASNSLLEGLVFGARAGQAMLEASSAQGSKPCSAAKPEASACNGVDCKASEAVIREIQELMWRQVGIVRVGRMLRQAVHQLQEMSERLPPPVSRRACEAHNLHLCGSVIARSALAREESRGAHYRTDFPAKDDAKFKKHSIIKGDAIRFE